MGFFDRLFGAPEPQRPVPPAPGRGLTPDELAIERYRYLLRTAPPEAIEQVHAEAFAKLTPEQRQQVYRALADQAPAGERLVSDDPSALARAATRQELRAPGSMERAFSNAGAQGGPQGAGRPGPSFGQMFGGSLLGSIAGVVVGTAIADAILPDPASFDAGGADAGADAGSVEAGGDTGGDFGGFGGDFGGGDFGGGDFGF
ncbi:hypothetical protein [Agromyces sp. S2-1-8]|uniref:hypothetical protein n=1 Tax=Agromyces sp. S2-1-8 TaxID=2897180 RepID=UPI001E502468|nr:hypothetical protein [Agromyces sp. S2-1-8]MCD5346926.1 hypothetical protein [Agromyces sp. S2-1-8]